MKIIKNYISKKIHFYTDELIIMSDYRYIYILEKNAEEKKIKLFGNWRHFFAFSRLLVRLLRSDQFNIITNVESREIYVIRDGHIYNYNLDYLHNKNYIGVVPFRGLMHGAHCILPDGRILFGNYGNKSSKNKIFLYIISPFTKTLDHSTVLNSFKAKHIHSIRWDSFIKKIWICTGDLDSECHIILLNENLSIFKIIGNGTQLYRTCDFIFKKDVVIWAMDSPLKNSFIVKYDRISGQIYLIQKINGPGWNFTKVKDNYYLSIIWEPGEAVNLAGPKILVSKDAENWSEFLNYTKDFWPSIFKFGVCEIGSSDGKYFYINHQGTKEKDDQAEVFI